MTPDEIRVLYDYNAWANRRMLDACAALSDEQFTRTIVSSFPSVRETLIHILAAEWIWLERWQERALTQSEWEGFAGQFTGLASIGNYWTALEKKRQDFIAALTPERLARVHKYETTEGTAYAQPLWQMMQHLANHSTYHRGQVTMMLRQLGAKPVGTDLITFYRQRAAQATA